MKKELLSPVGNVESLYSAIFNGCDAVYLSGKKFGARAYAENFTELQLVEAIKFCHLYGVKIYVTINTIIYQSEMTECIEYIRFLHQNNVDAIILQDLGLIKKVRETFPNLEIHASTQMHTHNLEQLKLYEKMGIKRAVLARELSLKEINSFKTNVELEIFIHGALCISYSGECLFSSLLFDRSGNCGRCAGVCRLPFSLFEENKRIETSGKYLLSPKELCTVSEFTKIMQSNVSSLKIEGRMKSASYVGYVTRVYRSLIDQYQQKNAIRLKEEEIKNLKVLYNRGFTTGHLFQATDSDFMNITSPNHQGIPLGKVVSVDKNKIKIQLSEDLHQEDGIRFLKSDKGMIVNYLYNEKGLLIKKAHKNEMVQIDNKIGLKEKDTVVKTIDFSLQEHLKKLPNRYVKINCTAILKIGQKFSLTFSDGEFTVQGYGSICEQAKKVAVRKEILTEKITALKNTPFEVENINITIDLNAFIAMSEVKNLRRTLINELIDKRKNRIPHKFVEQKVSIPKEKKREEINQKIALHALVYNEEQLKTCLELNLDSIIVSNFYLYQKYKKRGNLFLRLERVKNNFPPLKKENLVIEETGSLYKYHNTNTIVTDYPFHVVNQESVRFLNKMNVERITLSIENKLEDIRSLVSDFENTRKLEVYLYGRPEVMIMKYCPLHMLVNKNSVCSVCQNNKQYYLQDRNQKRYPIVSNSKENHLTHILYHQPINRLQEIAEYHKMGINHFRLEFFSETPNEIKSIISKIKECKI